MRTTDQFSPGILRGKWQVNYAPDHFSHSDILALLLRLRDHLEKHRIRPSFHHVLLNPGIRRNRLRLHKSRLTLEWRSIASSFPPVENLLSGDTPGLQEPKDFHSPTHRILHLLIATMGDKRWDTLSHTPAALYLGSTLSNRGFSFSCRRIFPDSPLSFVGSPNVVSISLYEDLFQETEKLLTRMKEIRGGLIAAGGPMATLHPLAAAARLSMLNLLVRGEGESVFPALLSLLGKGTIKDFFRLQGILYQKPGWILISDLDHTNRPPEFQNFRFNLKGLTARHFESGLEINLSRGCRRACAFCSKIHGSTKRRIPVDAFRDLLDQLEKKASSAVPGDAFRRVNINDDDILDSPDYLDKILAILKETGFRLWGIQASAASFFRSGHPDPSVIEKINRPELFAGGRPLVWIGTDGFHEERAPVLNKFIPSFLQISRLMQSFESAGILHYHYWIASDHRATWNRFLEEFIRIYRLKKMFPDFHLLPHSPFLVPYPSTSLGKQIQYSRQRYLIKYKIIYPNPGHRLLDLKLVQRLNTPLDSLNRLLENRSYRDNQGFFDFLSDYRFSECFEGIYTFIKEARLKRESDPGSTHSPASLKQAEKRCLAILTEDISFPGTPSPPW